MKKTKFLSLSILFVNFCFNGFSQNNFPEISPKWDKFYDDNPSEINQNFQATDFIQIERKVGFISTRKEFKNNMKSYETVLLKLPYSDLEQLKIHGLYYSRSYKHDDWFYVYNLTLLSDKNN